MNKDETTSELLEQLRDPKFYLERFTKIKGKKPGLYPFILKEHQKDIFNTLKLHKRVLIMKARQMGFSSAITGYFYHNTIMVPGTTTAIIGYNSDLTAELLDKIKTFLKTTPDELRPTVQYNSKYEVSFPKINSKILVLQSTENVGRGYALTNVLATELPYWEKAEEKMAALEASVPVDGRIVIESTPRNVGDLFHRMWMTEDNGYAKKEYGWWWEYDQATIDVIRKRMNNPYRFAAEYECQFLSSGRAVFDNAVINEQRKNIMKVGDPVKGTDYKVEEKDGLRIYRKPEKGKTYCLGADTSEGITGGDPCVAVIIDRATGEEVAFYRGYLAPDRFATMLDKWGRGYNNALVIVESNNHGLGAIVALRNLNYPCLYFRPQKFETMGTSYTDKIGWKTSRLTRPLLIDDLAQAMRDKELTIHSKEILDEMMTFVFNNSGDMVSMGGFHDDCIFATGICYQGFKVLYRGVLTQMDERESSHVNYSNY
jgi:hypothetical protein